MPVDVRASGSVEEVRDGLNVISQWFAARQFEADGEIVVELTDGFRPENAGRSRIGGDGAERTGASPGLALDVSGLGSECLDGFSFVELARARARGGCCRAGRRALPHRGPAVVRRDLLIVSRRSGAARPTRSGRTGRTRPLRA
jgi:hypothetical protein